MNYAEQLAALSATDPNLGSQLTGLRNLEAILKWAPAAGIPLAGIDLIQQDEYSYDLLLPLGARPSRPPFSTDAGETPAPPGDSRWLVFGVS